MWKGLRTAGLDNDTTMKDPIETVKESRCVSSCTPHIQCLCFHEMMAQRFKRTFRKNLSSLCWPKRVICLGENREN